MKKIISILLVVFSVMHADLPSAITPDNELDIADYIPAYFTCDSSESQEELFECYLKEAKEGDAGSQYEVAEMYSKGKGVKKDYKKALQWYLKVAEQGSAKAQSKIAYVYSNSWSAKEWGVKENEKLSFKWYSKAAKQGNTHAEFMLASMYYHGEGTKQDYKKAFNLFIKSAQEGSATSQLQIGDMYYRGEGVGQDNKEAFKWYLKAAEKNYNIAIQEKIAKMYYLGVGVEKSYKKSFSWYSKLANEGNEDAQNAIANMYYLGEGVTKNYKEALEFYNKSCRGYNMKSCIALGYFLSGNKHSDQYPINNSEEKNKYLKKNLTQISKLYTNFRNNKDNHEKFKYIMKAIENNYGNPYLYGQIALMYFKGEGIAKNYMKSYSWYSLAFSLNASSVYKKRLNYLEKKMTSQQIIIAQSYNPLKQLKKVDNKQEKSSQTYTGTGFFVDKSTVLTNHHVIKNCTSIELVRNGYKSGAKVKARDTINDLAILEADRPNISSLNFRAGNGIRIGNDIIVIGYPLGYLLGSGIKLTTGNVSALTGLVNDTTQMQLTAPVQPGNSGGALLDESGNVVGVIVARLKKGQNVNLAIKSNVAQMFLDINNVDYGVAMSKDKKEAADIADEAKESIVQVVCYQ